MTFAVIFLLVLLPAGYLTEFNPRVLFDATSLRASKQFLATFFPPAHTPAFLQLLVRSAWKTVAIATSGMVLALVLAIPLSLIANRTLSISRLGTGTMGIIPATVRAGIRWGLGILRSIPELVWALCFVRAVGLGDTAGVMAIALTYAGMIGKVFLEIYESQDTKAAEALLANGARSCHSCWCSCCWSGLPTRSARGCAHGSTESPRWHRVRCTRLYYCLLHEPVRRLVWPLQP
jgi:phosphonate transport system permease protein